MNITQPVVECYFHLSSPYSCVAPEWIEPLVARRGHTVRWPAILRVAAFAAAQLQPALSRPVGLEYPPLDSARSARFPGLPLQMPEQFSMPTNNAASLFRRLDSDGPGLRARLGGMPPAGLFVPLRRRVR